MFHKMDINTKKEVFKKFLITMIIGTFITLVGVAIAYWALPDGALETTAAACHAAGESHGYLDTGFARKWDGSCTGWTRGLSLKFILSDLMHWWAYVLISLMILTRHPSTSNGIGYKVVIWLSGAFIFGCGVTHLVGAYTVINPLYEMQGWVNLANGIVSVIAMIFVVYGLIRSVVASKERDEELKQGLSNLVDRYKNKDKK